MTKKGFTIVELLLAMAFFSFILLFVVSGFIQINRSYTRGVVVRRVQDGARVVIEEITRSMRNASSVQALTPDGGPYRICFGSVRYGWNQQNRGVLNTTPAHSNEQFDGEKINFIKSYDGTGSCSDPFAPTENVTSPLDSSVQIQDLVISNVGTSNSWYIKVVTSSTDPTDFTTYGADAACFVRIGDQYCDIAELETVVTLRN